MRNALVATALALVLSPAAAGAQEPNWIFEVPYEVQALNQGVSDVRVMCATRDHFSESGYDVNDIGYFHSEKIQLDANGSASGVATVEVRTTAGKSAGQATHYACWLYLDWNLPDPNAQPITLQPKSGTTFVPLVAGTLP